MEFSLNKIETVSQALAFLREDLGYQNFCENIKLHENFLDSYGHEFRFEKDGDIICRFIGLEQNAPRNSKVRQELKRSPDFGEEEFLMLVRAKENDIDFADREIDPVIEFIRIELRPSTETVEVVNDLRYFRVNKDDVEPMYIDYFDQLHVSSGQRYSDVEKRIKEVFSLKKITRRFYEEFSDIFHSTLIPAIDGFEGTADELNSYARLVVNRILFLMFLQEKGWLNEDKRYIQNKYNEIKEDGGDVYTDFFSPLFFDALNNQSKRNFEFLGKIPYLNGGLFEKRDFEEPVYIEKEFFEALLNSEEDERGIKKGFLLRYKLSLSESNPSEQELVVDPEFIGRIFEMFMLENERKDKGTFYTPKEITQYMSQNSLKHYLLKHFPDEEDLIISLITSKEINGEIDETLVKEIIEKINDVKIVDPAVGSGAFIISMLDEIVEIIETLNKLLDKTVNRFDLKEKFIAENVYGVDIDPSGIEFCKFRTWLYLIKDVPLGLDELLDKNDKYALPNLDFKFFVGNSLVGDFRPVDIGGLLEKTFDDETDKDQPKSKYGKLSIQSRFDVNSKGEFNIYELGKEIGEVRSRYIDTHGKEKIELEGKLKTLIDKLDGLIDWDTSDYWMREVIEEAPKPYFKWSIYLPEIFLNGGFDIVIGNPPYQGASENKQDYVGDLSHFYDKKYDFYKTIPRMRHDLYQKFIIRGWELLKEDGILTFITSSTFLTIGSKQTSRKLLQQNKLHDLIIANPDTFIATVNPAIFSFSKSKEEYHVCDFIDAFTTSIDYYRSFVKIDEQNDIEKVKEHKLSDDLSVFFTPITIYKNNLRYAFFKPTNKNLKIYDKYMKNVKDLAEKWEYEIRDSDTLEENLDKIKTEHLDHLEEGDVTLLGLLTIGGVGLQTPKNDDYLAYLDGTRSAEKVKERNGSDFEYIDKNEKQFSSMSRVVKEENIADVEHFDEEEKLNGIERDTDRTWVPIVKGKGEPYYKPITEYINWSKEWVEKLYNDPGSYIRNSNCYFKEGLFISRGGTGEPVIRYSPPAVIDSSGGIYIPTNEKVSAKYLNGLLNSNLIQYMIDNFLNHTVNTQVTDMRHVPIIIPDEDELESMEELVDEAILIQKGELDESLEDVRKKIDELTEDIYGVTLDDD